MVKPDDLIVSLMSNILEKMLREIVEERLENMMNVYLTESQTNHEKRQAVEPSVYSGLSKFWELPADIAVANLEKGDARLFGDWVPRKKRSLGHRSSSSRTMTTPWMRVIEQQISITSVEPVLQNPNPDSESSQSSCVIQSNKRRSINVEKEYGTDEDKSFKLLCAAAADMLLEYEAKKEKSEKEEPRVYSGQINMLEMMHEDIGERLESLLEHRSITSEEPVLQIPNPDSESSQLSCVIQSNKRRSNNVEERRRKKRKIVRCLEVEPIQTRPPEWLLNVMRREENGYNPKLISTRKLFKTDLHIEQARLSVPFNQVKHPDFLTEEETIFINQNAMKLRKEGVSVDLVDPQLNKHVLDLRKWKMSGNWYYVFVKGWNDVVAANRFKVDDVFPLWSFRSGRGKLCFALVPSQATNSSHGGGSTWGESGRGNSLTGGDGASTSGESGQVPLPVPPSPLARDSSHSGQGCSGESSSRSS